VYVVLQAFLAPVRARSDRQGPKNKKKTENDLRQDLICLCASSLQFFAGLWGSEGRKRASNSRRDTAWLQ